MSDYRTIVVPYDFSEHARAALVIAVDFAGRLGSELALVHVLHQPIYVGAYGAAPLQLDLTQLRDTATRALREVADACDLPREVAAHVVEGPNVAASIRETAENLGADLIVMGTHGRTGLAHVFLGSVAERTLRDAPCPVLTVKASDV